MWYYIQHYFDWGKTKIRDWHPIPRHWMSVMMILKKIDCIITPMHCIDVFLQNIFHPEWEGL